ncbi:VWA domain-containing protein [Terrihabitans soli]|uniref:VWA domain-containing protein n=1 Tax=Terrihabitans soli TaxID=708113 RepID=A0A6S6QJ74_9HYPH|nr:pilus assembly protein [Terrihabitans soli]BCJ90324.1 VWA domain-containing protein [Terrihabitans soli]
MNALKRFRRDCKGSVAIIFALAIVPVVAAIGAAFDFARGVQKRDELQALIDSALLSVSRSSVTMSDDQVAAKIRAYILSIGYPAGELGTVTISRNGQTLSAKATAKVPTTVMKMAGIKELNIEAKATARWAKAEIVLVLDNSGSMGSGNRLTMLKSAVKDFVDKSAGSDNAMVYGMVPFAQAVRVPVTQAYKDAVWIDWGTSSSGSEDGEDGSSTQINKSTWQGCLIDRPQPYHTDDTFYADSKKYPAIQSCIGDETHIGLVQDLGTTPANLKAAVDAMGSGGYTNLVIGVAWGHAMLTKQLPFVHASAPGETRRIMILMTDGHNTKNRFSNSETTLDGWTKTACKAAKDAGIEIYTVGFIGGDADVLSDCASGTGNHLTAATVNDIGNVFQQLALAVRRPILSH